MRLTSFILDAVDRIHKCGESTASMTEDGYQRYRATVILIACICIGLLVIPCSLLMMGAVMAGAKVAPLLAGNLMPVGAVLGGGSAVAGITAWRIRRKRKPGVQARTEEKEDTSRRPLQDKNVDDAVLQIAK